MFIGTVMAGVHAGAASGDTAETANHLPKLRGHINVAVRMLVAQFMGVYVGKDIVRLRAARDRLLLEAQDKR